MKTLLPILLFVLSLKVYSQNVGINSTGATPYPSAMLDVRSATKGLLIPRHSTVSKLAIASPDSGLIVLDTTIWCISIYNGATWFDLCVNSSTPSCPPGFVRVPGRNYCIEVNERPVCEWDTANVTCLRLGYRLCHFGEWRYACFRQIETEDNLGNVVPLQDMIGNNEWTWNVDGGGGAVAAGSGSCTNFGGISIYTASPRFRCCHTP